ncbi:MAG: MFS transporter [Chloroflexi bacterium]|nr:MFS transporter [Chloroflexota bacterium]
MPALIAVSALAGLGTGFALGSMSTYSYDIIPEHARGQLQSLRRTFGQLGQLTGPLAGGALADRFNPGMVFLFMARSISSAPCSSSWLPGRPTKAAPSPDA